MAHMPSGSWKVRRGLAVVVSMLLSSPAVADDLSGSYLCVQEVGGGLRFDETTRKWTSANFRAEDKLVFTLKFLGSGEDKYIGSYADYTITISILGGSSEPETCLGRNPDYSVRTWGRYFACSSITQYQVNLEDMRYLETYAVGYVDGKDNNENTPSIFGGTCAKIN